MREQISHYFLLSRPYSWVDLVGIALVAQLLFGVFNALFLVGVLFAWIAFCFYLEWCHKHPYRISVSFLSVLAFSALAIVSFTYMRGFVNVMPLLAAIIFGIAYTFKKASPLAVGLFKAALVFLAAPLSPALFLAGVFFWHAGRNLAGDIRDKDFDKHSPAKALGNLASTVSFASMFIGLLLFSFYASLVLVAGTLVVLVFVAHYSLRHFILVFASILLVFIFLQGAREVFLLIIGAVVLRFTYWRVARPSNKLALQEWKKLFSSHFP